MQHKFGGGGGEGGPRSDPAILDELPGELCAVLRSKNGFILHGGCLHVRGASFEPACHSIRRAWRGHLSIVALYGLAESFGVPFAQDCVGDQFLLCAGFMWTLSAESGS